MIDNAWNDIAAASIDTVRVTDPPAAPLAPVQTEQEGALMGKRAGRAVTGRLVGHRSGVAHRRLTVRKLLNHNGFLLVTSTLLVRPAERNSVLSNSRGRNKLPLPVADSPGVTSTVRLERASAFRRILEEVERAKT
jgi:hypothetical protein